MFEDIEFSSQPIDSFGGLVFFERFVEGSFHFDKIVSNILGERPVQAEYSFSDVLYSFMACTVTGGSFGRRHQSIKSKNAFQLSEHPVQFGHLSGGVEKT